MPKLDLDAIPSRQGSDYPPPHDEPVAGRAVRILSEAARLEDFVVTRGVIPPGGWSSQRHWHEGEDEFVVVLAGRGVLVDDLGRRAVGPGDCLAFPKGEANGHHIVNEGDGPLVLVAVSLPERSPCHYPDIGLSWSPKWGYRNSETDAPC